MGDKTAIEWTDATWNPVTGCAKVSAGCKHCYAEREWPRMQKLTQAYAGRDFTDVRTHADRLDQPLRWKRPRMIFVNSMSDLFHEDVPDYFIDQVFAVMALTPQHTFQVLTKRPERMRQYFAARRKGDPWAEAADYIADLIGMDEHPIVLEPRDIPLPNVWLGVSVENQAAADERIPLLLDTPAAVRWISAEPLIGPVSFRWAVWHDYSSREPGFVHNQLDGMRVIDWVVVGGESGPKARPMHPQWARDLRDQCAAAGVPFLFKQWGEWGNVWGAATHLIYADGTVVPGTHEHPDAWKNKTAETMTRVGKKAAGRLLDGVTHDGYPGGAK